MNPLLSGLLVAVLAQSGGDAPYARTRVPDAGTLAPCLAWDAPVVRFQQAAGGVTPGQQEAVRRAWQTWDAALAGCTPMRVEEGPPATGREVGWSREGPNENRVVFRTRACDDLPACAGLEPGECANAHDCSELDADTLALATTTYLRSTGRILDADVELNAAHHRFTTADGPACAPSGEGCACPTAAPCVLTDVQNTMTHEVGHVFGLDHTSDPGSVMYRSAPPGETSKRALDPGTLDFVCSVYPRDLPPQACVVRPFNGTLGREQRGCSAGAGGPAALALLALGALAVLRRPGSVHRNSSR